MDSYEFNKIAGWVLTALVTVLGLSILTGAMFPIHKPEQPAFIVEGVEEAGAAGGDAAAAEKPIEFYLANADVTKGEAQFKKCASCHTIEKGGANGIGPNLYGIVGNRHAHAEGFNYSPAMRGLADKPWTYEELNAWIHSPRGYAPGNRMSYAGLSNAQQRANLIAYLRSISPNAPAP